MAVIRNFRLPIGVGISADYIETFGVIQTTNPNTGAIVSRGGVGVGNSISIAGHLQLFNGANYTAFVSSALGNTLYTLPATSPATGSSVLQSTSAGVMSWVPMVPNFSVSAGTATTATYAHQSGYAITSGSSGTSTTATYSHQSGYAITAGTATTATNLNVVAAATNATHYILFSPINGGSGVAVSSDAGLFFNPGSNTLTTTTFAAGSAVNTVTASVSGSTASTSTSTGALVVTGGVGIGQSLNTSSSYASSISGVVANNGVITSGSWAGSTITVNYGGTGYSTYTKGDLIVGAGSTFIKVGIGASHQVLSYSATAASGLGWTDLSLMASISTCYGAFYSTQTQQVYGANTITPITLNNTFEAANVQIYGGAGTSSRIQINSTGVFNIQFSAQINLASGNQTKVGDFWFRIDGTDVPFSNTKMSVNGKDFHSVIALNFVSTFTKGQYFELMMNSADSNFLLEGIGASTGPVRPFTPSMIVSVTKVL
jgi:hypothetical protein